jgi:flavin reductase (DIM6/NTAB) family NADH-FMN oxidoreductase RutF
MSKKRFGPQPWLFPNPCVIVGALVDGKPNVATYAWSGITGGDPPTISVGIRHERHTLKGIHQNRTFSVNIPSIDLLKEADYCGIVSGRDTDKVKDCGFTVFYGTLDTAPLIEQCAVNLECEVLHMLNVGLHMLVIGKIVETHVNEGCLTENQPDIMKIRPIVYSRGAQPKYNSVGELLGIPFQTGRILKTKESPQGD